MSDEKTVAWRYAAKRSDIASAKIAPAKIAPARIGGARIGGARIGGAVHAFGNIGTHAFARPSDSFVEGDQVEGPLHQAQSRTPTGKALTPPASVDARVYPVKLEGDDVYAGVADRRAPCDFQSWIAEMKKGRRADRRDKAAAEAG